MVNVRERHRGSSYGTDAAEPAPEPDPPGGYSPRVFVRAALAFFRDTHCALGSHRDCKWFD
jgi:hypothetical protein